MKKIFLLPLIFVLLTIPVPVSAQSLDINLGVPSGQPIFTIKNMLPGDEVIRTVQITNNEDHPVPFAVRGELVENSPEDPLLENMLVLTVHFEGSQIYQSPVNEFLDMEKLELPVVPGNSEVELEFNVNFPTEAGNEYQNKKVVFDLVFVEDITLEPHLVINEVYFEQDEENGGLDGTGKVEANISGNGPGSKNIINISIGGSCIVLQNNDANVSNDININAATGGNNSDGGVITTGKASVSLNLFNQFNLNILNSSCSSRAGPVEWVEIYNPTDERIRLNRYYLVENSNVPEKLKKSLAPGQFAVVGKRQVLRSLDLPAGTKKIYIDKFGDGLNADSDHLRLLDRQSVEVDSVGWGDDTVIWDPAIPIPQKGGSLERLSPGYDTNFPSDWANQLPPTPGH